MASRLGIYAGNTTVYSRLNSKSGRFDKIKFAADREDDPQYVVGINEIALF